MNPKPLRLDAPATPAVEDVCHWLSQTPTLDEVAKLHRQLHLVHREMGQVMDLLRSHVLIALGERNGGLQVHIDEEPF
jgi:hypothetical protein